MRLCYGWESELNPKPHGEALPDSSLMRPIPNEVSKSPVRKHAVLVTTSQIMGHEIVLSVTKLCLMSRMGSAFQGGVTGAWGHSHWSFLLVALLCFCIRGSTALTLQAVPASPVLGGKVVLTFSFPGQMNIVNWYRARADELVQSNVILTYSPSSNNVTNGNRRTGRERVFANGSLEISNLQTTDNGYYTVELIPTDGSYNQLDTINLMISGAPATVNPATQPGPAYITTTTTTAQPTGADGSPRENRSPTGAIVGAIVGAVVAVLLVMAAVLLYKRHQNQRRTDGEPFTNAARKDLKIHNQRKSTDLDQRSDPTKNQLPSPAYETVLPSLSQTLQDQEGDHIYTDLEFADQNVYNQLQK